MKTPFLVAAALAASTLAGCAVVPVEPYGPPPVAYGPPVVAVAPAATVVVRPAPRYRGWYGPRYRYWR